MGGPLKGNRANTKGTQYDAFGHGQKGPTIWNLAFKSIGLMLTDPINQKRGRSVFTRKWTSRIDLILFFAFGALLCTHSGCSEPAANIVVVAPAGFRGPILIRPAPNGQTVQPDESGRYVYKIPPSGVLKVSSTTLLQKWHTLDAQWSDGTELAVQKGPSDSPLSLHEVWIDSDRVVVLFVGSSKDAADLRRGGPEKLAALRRL
jgi:hypothetical protein